VVGGPRWVNAKTFDVDASVEDSQVEQSKLYPDRLAEQMRLRVQSLLADRFKLRVRRQTKGIPIYSLIVAKGGPKLAPPDPSSDRFAPGVFPFESPENWVCPAGMACLKSQMSMAEMAYFLSRGLRNDRPVIDRTGLEGDYAIELLYTNRRSPTAMVSAADRGTQGIASAAPPRLHLPGHRSLMPFRNSLA
jgi:uncharacterized protein (TIGR03435 family)